MTVPERPLMDPDQDPELEALEQIRSEGLDDAGEFFALSWLVDVEEDDR